MDIAALVHQCAPWVAPETITAIIKTESQFQPYAIGVNGSAKLERQPQSKSEAVATANWLLARGYNIDLGLGQVNSANLKKAGLSVDDAFDPCQNVAAAATILKMNYRLAKQSHGNDQDALFAAISAYNTGSFTKGYRNGYVQKVADNAGAQVPAIKPKAYQPIPLKQATPGHKAPEKAMVYGGKAAPDQAKGVLVYGGKAAPQRQDDVMVY